MAYKRRVRVVFLTGNRDGMAGLAVQLTGQVAAAWMEARALGPSEDEEEVMPQLTDAEVQWADVLITMDQAGLQALKQMPALPVRVQHRHYPFEPDEIDQASLRARLRARIMGMAGGLRLLERAAEEA